MKVFLIAEIWALIAIEAKGLNKEEEKLAVASWQSAVCGCRYR
jgi:hypothetical protein